MDDKATKDSVRYTDHGTEKEHCSICRRYIRGGACMVVAGRVSPRGWCNRFLVLPHAAYGYASMHRKAAR